MQTKHNVATASSLLLLSLLLGTTHVVAEEENQEPTTNQQEQKFDEMSDYEKSQIHGPGPVIIEDDTTEEGKKLEEERIASMQHGPGPVILPEEREQWNHLPNTSDGSLWYYASL